MHRKIALIFMILLSLLTIAACGSATIPFAPVTILPESCHVMVGQQMPLTLDGFISSQAFVSWEVDKGRITFVLTGSDAVFIAPSEPGVVTISASITPGLSSMRTPPTRQCTVTKPNDLAQADGFGSFPSIWLRFPNSSAGLLSY